MQILKTTLAAVFALSLFSAGARADAVPPLEKCVVNGDSFSEHKHGPLDATYNGRTISVCCKSCLRKFNKNPEKFLKEWDEALKAKGVTPPAAK